MPLATSILTPVMALYIVLLYIILLLLYLRYLSLVTS